MTAPAVEDTELTAQLVDLPDVALSCVLGKLESLEDVCAAEQSCSLMKRVLADGSTLAQLVAAVLDSSAVSLIIRHLPALATSFPSPSPELSTRALLLRLAKLVRDEPGARSLLAEALHASSTDNENEALRNTLSSRTEMTAWDRPCYWSSGGTVAKARLSVKRVFSLLLS